MDEFAWGKWIWRKLCIMANKIKILWWKCLDCLWTCRSYELKYRPVLYCDVVWEMRSVWSVVRCVYRVGRKVHPLLNAYLMYYRASGSCCTQFRRAVLHVRSQSKQWEVFWREKTPGRVYNKHRWASRPIKINQLIEIYQLIVIVIVAPSVMSTGQFFWINCRYYNPTKPADSHWSDPGVSRANADASVQSGQTGRAGAVSRERTLPATLQTGLHASGVPAGQHETLPPAVRALLQRGGPQRGRRFWEEGKSTWRQKDPGQKKSGWDYVWVFEMGQFTLTWQFWAQKFCFYFLN